MLFHVPVAWQIASLFEGDGDAVCFGAGGWLASHNAHELAARAATMRGLGARAPGALTNNPATAR
jgi:hypothetical protein